MQKTILVIITLFFSACSYNKSTNETSPFTTITIDSGKDIHVYEPYGNEVISFQVNKETYDKYANSPQKQSEINEFNLTEKIIFVDSPYFAKKTKDNKIIITKQADNAPKNNVASN